MRIKVSNYIAKKLLEAGITDVFMITGGGAMHLDDALGHQEWRQRPMRECTARLPPSV